MGENVIVIVDLGHDDCELIRKDVESLGVRAEVCEYEADADYLNSLGEIKGIIFDGGSGKMVNGFRAEPSESFYDLKVPVYSVDHGMMLAEGPGSQRQESMWAAELFTPLAV